MKKIRFLVKVAFFVVVVYLHLSAQEKWDEAFTFIVAADMRNFATEDNHSPQHFPGALSAINKVGKGAFMIIPGDLDVEPPGGLREVITKVLGEDYPWYLVVGNHEPESPSTMDYIRQNNKNEKNLPNLVRRGPRGCEETTYSFEWNNCHFIVLNQYYDGQTDWGTDGDVIPELLNWLEEDLSANTKKHILVFGHEPILAMPDMDNGRVRHLDDSLNKYPKNAFRFHQLLFKYGVTAYICGHTHNTSYAKINGLWQIDAGHARGMEDKLYPDELYKSLVAGMLEGKKHNSGEQKAIKEHYEANTKKIDKWLKYMGLKGTPVVQLLAQFYSDYKKGGDSKEKYFQALWQNAGWARSTFLKFYVTEDKVKLEIYRSDVQGDSYSLRHSEILY